MAAVSSAVNKTLLCRFLPPEPSTPPYSRRIAGCGNPTTSPAKSQDWYAVQYLAIAELLWAQISLGGGRGRGRIEWSEEPMSPTIGNRVLCYSVSTGLIEIDDGGRWSRLGRKQKLRNDDYRVLGFLWIAYP